MDSTERRGSHMMSGVALDSLDVDSSERPMRSTPAHTVSGVSVDSSERETGADIPLLFPINTTRLVSNF